MTFRVRQIRADEALRLRALRLHALADAPSAFGSTLERESAFPDTAWRERAREGAVGKAKITYVAENGDRWVGMATGIADALEEPQPMLVGMFVEHASRGRGVGTALVETVAAWARGRSAVRLELWVTSTNAPAVRLYQRCGFRPTGHVKPHDHIASLVEVEMVRDL